MINEGIKHLELTNSLLQCIFGVIYKTKIQNGKLGPTYWLKWSQFARNKSMYTATSSVIQYSFELIFYGQNFRNISILLCL